MANFNLCDVWCAARELNEGNNAPSAKFALQIACCSAQQSLSNNGLMARVLAKYVVSGLPEESVLHAEFMEEKVLISDNHIKGVYWAEYLDKQDLLGFMYKMPTDLDGQRAWRNRVYDLFHPIANEETGKTVGKGLGYKTISFAFLLMYPENCLLAILDRHHLARMGKKQQSLGYHVAYERVENELIAERDLYLKQTGLNAEFVPLGIFGWYKWQEYREEKGVSTSPVGEVQSHLMLSCRWFD